LTYFISLKFSLLLKSNIRYLRLINFLKIMILAGLRQDFPSLLFPSLFYESFYSFISYSMLLLCVHFVFILNSFCTYLSFPFSSQLKFTIKVHHFLIILIFVFFFFIFLPDYFHCDMVFTSLHYILFSSFEYNMIMLSNYPPVYITINSLIQMF
jgi:hypothetical protein